MANSYIKTYVDGAALTEGELDSALGSVQPTQANLALSTTGSSANDIHTSAGSNLTPVWASPNTVAATITATGANSIFSNISSAQASVCNLIIDNITSCSATAANLVVSAVTSCSAAAANTIIQASTRTTGTTVTYQGLAISANSGSYTTSSTTATAVTNLSVSITTSGRPVEVGLRGMPSLTSYFGIAVPIGAGSTSATGTFILQRDGSQIGAYEAKATLQSGCAFELPPGAINTKDVASAGTFVYTLLASADLTANTVSVKNCQLYAIET